MSRQINNKKRQSRAIVDIVCLLGALVSIAIIAFLSVDSCASLDLHANGYTAEATVTEKLRKSKARVQFTDYSGNSQTAIINRIPIFCDDNRYTIRYSPKYPEKAVVCEWPDMLVLWSIKIVSLILLSLTAFALFPCSRFKKKATFNQSE